MGHYQVVAGLHHRKGEVFKKGDVVESESDLTELYPKKFREVSSTISKLSKGKSKTGALLDKNKGLVGKDVSRLFPTALEKSLRVLRTDDQRYHVTTEDDPATPLNPQPLLKLKVKKFLEAYSA